MENEAITLDKAVKSERKVKVISISNEILNFHSVEFNNDRYYGVLKKGTDIKKIMLEEDLIKSIRFKGQQRLIGYILALPLIVISVFFYGLFKDLNAIEYEFDVVF